MKNTLIVSLVAVLGLGALVVAQEGPAYIDDPLPCILVSGEGQLKGGSALVTFPPGWKPGLQVENLSVVLTCQNGWSPLYASPVFGQQFKVGTNKQGDPNQKFSWVIVGSIKVR